MEWKNTTLNCFQLALVFLLQTFTLYKNGITSSLNEQFSNISNANEMIYKDL